MALPKTGRQLGEGVDIQPGAEQVSVSPGERKGRLSQALVSSKTMRVLLIGGLLTAGGETLPGFAQAQEEKAGKADETPVLVPDSSGIDLSALDPKEA